jgi:small basic protein (TIGR04137 family)
LKYGSKLKRQRNVLSRSERIEKLEDQGKWSEEDSVYGLPTVKVAKIRTGKKKKKAKEAEEEAAEAAPEAETEE